MQGWRVSIIERAKREYRKDNIWLGKRYIIRNIEDVKNRSCERTGGNRNKCIHNGEMVRQTEEMGSKCYSIGITPSRSGVSGSKW
jgi:hypothetical protein